MTYDGRLSTRCERPLLDEVDEIAERTGLDRSDVVRRLLRLGVEDVSETGDEILLGQNVGHPVAVE